MHETAGAFFDCSTTPLKLFLSHKNKKLSLAEKKEKREIQSTAKTNNKCCHMGQASKIRWTVVAVCFSGTRLLAYLELSGREAKV